MALSTDFYSEIFKNEQKWIEYINSNFINITYCKLELRPFYIDKKNILEKEYEATNNQILGQVLNVIDKIINKLDFIINEYQNEDIKALESLFLVNQMNNNNLEDEIDYTKLR